MKSNLDLFWDNVKSLVEAVKNKPRYFEVYIRTDLHRIRQEIDTFKIEVTEEYVQHTSDAGIVTRLITKSDHTYLEDFEFEECQVDEVAYLLVKNNFMFRSKVGFEMFMDSECTLPEWDDDEEDFIN